MQTLDVMTMRNAFASVAVKCGITVAIRHQPEFMMLLRDTPVLAARADLTEQVTDMSHLCFPESTAPQVAKLFDHIREVTGRTATGIICVKTAKRSVSKVLGCDSDVLATSFSVPSGVFIVGHTMANALPIEEGVVAVVPGKTEFAVYNGDREKDLFTIVVRLEKI